LGPSTDKRGPRPENDAAGRDFEVGNLPSEELRDCLGREGVGGPHSATVRNGKKANQSNGDVTFPKACNIPVDGGRGCNPPASAMDPNGVIR